jgi:MFS family permease
MVPSAFALVRSRVPAAGQAKAFGAFGALMGIAAAIGPLLGGEIAHALGWPALFVVNAPPVAIAAILARSGVVAPRRAMPRFDVIGSLLLACGLVLAVIGMRAKQPAMVVGGALVLVGFFLWERRAANPVIDPALFRMRAFAAGVSVIGLQNLAMYAVLFEMPAVMSRAFSSDSAEAGRTLLWLTGAMVCGSLGSGRVVGKIGARPTAIIGALLATAGMTILALLPAAAPLDFAPGLAVLGLGIGLTTPSVQTLVMGSVERSRSGMAAGVSSTARYLGGVIGVGVVSSMLGGGDILDAHAHAALVLAGSLGLAGIAAIALPSSGGSGASRAAG